MDGSPSSHSCVPVSVERVDKDTDANENVDADQTIIGRPVSRSRELVKKIESHPHRAAVQADSSCAKQYQKCNVLNVFSIGIKV